LRRSGELSLRAWLADLCRTDCLPYFSWSDPVPSLHVAFSRIKGYRKRRLAREISPSPMGDTA
ncbi:MAG TPA: hypothetical protein VK943_08220, partial [Arenibaculum sp.]|nr:hypothetical protein [Arenibaculum sp.]